MENAPYREISIVEREKKLHNIRKFATLLDSQFTIPGINYKFGIDPILGLIPFIGSFSGFITGFVLIWMGRKNGARGLVLLKMIGNISLDFVIGLVPVVGNVADFVIKSNERNYNLLEEHFLYDKNNKSGWPIVIAFIITTTVLLIGSSYAIYWMLTGIFEYFNIKPF